MSGYQEPPGGSSSPSTGSAVGSKPIRAILRLFRGVNISAEPEYGTNFIPALDSPFRITANNFQLNNPAKTFYTSFESPAILENQFIKLPTITTTEGGARKDEVVLLKQSQEIKNKGIDINPASTNENQIYDDDADDTFIAGFDNNGLLGKVSVSSIPNVAFKNQSNIFTQPQIILHDSVNPLLVYRPSNGVIDWGIDFTAWDSVGGQTSYGFIRAGLTDNTDGSEDAYIGLGSMRSGTLDYRMLVSPLGLLYVRGQGTTWGIFDVGTNVTGTDKIWTMQNQNYIVIGRDTTDTLSNKNISPTTNILPFLNSFAYSIYQDGGQVRLRNNKTGAITSYATLGPAITAVLASGDPNFEVQTGTYNLASFSGWNVVSNMYARFHPNTFINVPNAYASFVWNFSPTSGMLSEAVIDGGNWNEQGTPALNWNFINMQPVGSNVSVYNCTFKNLHLANCLSLIYCNTTGQSWANTNHFENILVYPGKYLIWIDHVAGTYTRNLSGANSNKFKNVKLQSTGVTLGGIILNYGMWNSFEECEVWDMTNPAASSMTIGTNAEHTKIKGGLLTHHNFVNNGKNTRIEDQKHNLPFMSSFTYTIWNAPGFEGTVYLRNNKTGAVTTHNNLDAPLWTSVNSGDPSVEIMPATYDMHSSFGGIAFPSFTHVYAHPGTKFRVPQGYTGGFWVPGVSASSNIQYFLIEGGTYDEQGTPAYGWDCIRPSPPSPHGVTSGKFKDMVVYHAKRVVHHVTDGASWVNSNIFENVQGESCKELYNTSHTGTWTQGTSGANKNKYKDFVFHSNWSDSPDPDGGILNVRGEEEDFSESGAYDLWNNAAAKSMTILSTAIATKIDGGFLTHDEFEDNGTLTMAWDRYVGLYNKNISQLLGGMKYNLSTAKTANYTATTLDYRIPVNTTSGNITISLPAAASASGHEYLIYKTDSSSNSLIIDPNDAETINGLTTMTLTGQHQQAKVFSDGTKWYARSDALPNGPVDGLTLVKTAVPSGGETIFNMSVSDAPGDYFELGTSHITDGSFSPLFRSVQNAATSPSWAAGLWFQTLIKDANDSGTVPLNIFSGSTIGGNPLVNRPIAAIANKFTNEYIFWPTYLEFLDARDIKVGTTTGTKIGTAATQKLGFFGQTPRVQLAYDASPTATTIRDALISLGLMAAS